MFTQDTMLMIWASKVLGKKGRKRRTKCKFDLCGSPCIELSNLVPSKLTQYNLGNIGSVSKLGVNDTVWSSSVKTSIGSDDIGD